jgi:hypothetical protein
VSTSSTSPWATGKTRRSGPFPRRSLEIGAIVLGFIYWWPLALGYVIWKVAGYPALAEMRGFMDRAAALSGGARRSRFAAAFEASTGGRTGNLAFDAYRQAEIERLVARRRALDAESRAFAEFVEELKRAKDREQFDAYMAKRRSETREDGSPVDV